MNDATPRTEASEHEAVPLHSESQIQLLVHDVISVDAGKSFAISINLLVTTMLPHPQDDYLKAYKIAADKLLIRLKNADCDRARRMAWCCDEVRHIVYFGMKDHHGRFECKDL